MVEGASIETVSNDQNLFLSTAVLSGNAVNIHTSPKNGSQFIQVTNLVGLHTKYLCKIVSKLGISPMGLGEKGCINYHSS